MPNEYIALYTNKDRTSPWSHRIEIALSEAGVQPAIGLIDLKDRPEWFTTIVNPLTKQIPAIAYGGPTVPADQPSSKSVKLAESGVLLEFLADIYPEAKLLPTDPVQRAKARFFIEKANSTFIRSWLMFHKGEGSKEDVFIGLKTMQNLLPEKGFAVGEWSIADAAVAPLFGWAQVALREGLGSYEEGAGPEMYREIFEGERFGRWVEYWRENEARESWKNTWDEARLLRAYNR
ncbi:hypothetical protein PENSPDRAFT_748849 [Peniophora sp. CONT]|nr:hypothetical protein PENSPDRAFT_748849 [Peniophora sp. CONT]